MDAELQQVFNLAVSSGVTLFDTADSYGASRGCDCAKSLALHVSCVQNCVFRRNSCTKRLGAHAVVNKPSFLFPAFLPSIELLGIVTSQYGSCHGMQRLFEFSQETASGGMLLPRTCFKTPWLFTKTIRT